MRRRLAAVGVLAAALCVVPAAASAHDHSVALDCDGLRVDLSYYRQPPSGESNTLRVYVDGDLVATRDFDTELRETFDVGSRYDSHSVEVQVRAWDDENGLDPNDGDPSWSFDWNGSVDACAEPTPRPTPEPTPEPTPRPTPEPTPEPTPQPTPEPTPQPTPEPTPDVTPAPTPDVTPAPTPDVTPAPTPDVTPAPTPDVTPAPTPDVTERPDRTPRPTPKATERPRHTPKPTVPAEPTVPPGMDLPPTDTAGDFGATSGGQGGDQSGLLLGMAILASTGAAFIVLSLRRGAANKG